MRNIRKKIYDIIEPLPDSGKSSKVYDSVMILCITASLIPLAFKGSYMAFYVLDKVCVGFFIVDYLCRWLTADYKYGRNNFVSFIRYPFSLMAIIDLISILPSFTFFNAGLKVFRVLRMAKAFRVFRIFKAVRHSKSIDLIIKVMKKSKNSLITVGTLALAYIAVSALVMFNVEPESFDSFFEAFYWATVSLTTVGYGDIYPVTAIGRIVAMISSVLGIAIVALPSGIITAGYMEEIRESERN